MDAIRQDVVDALVWLDHGQAQALLQALVKGPAEGWQGAVERFVPDLRGQADLSDPRWREAILEELERRVAGVEDDFEDLDTIEVPNLARFAADLRGSRETARLGDPEPLDDDDEDTDESRGDDEDPPA